MIMHYYLYNIPCCACMCAFNTRGGGGGGGGGGGDMVHVSTLMFKCGCVRYVHCVLHVICYKYVTVSTHCDDNNNPSLVCG